MSHIVDISELNENDRDIWESIVGSLVKLGGVEIDEESRYKLNGFRFHLWKYVGIDDDDQIIHWDELDEYNNPQATVYNYKTFIVKFSEKGPEPEKESIDVSITSLTAITKHIEELKSTMDGLEKHQAEILAKINAELNPKGITIGLKNDPKDTDEAILINTGNVADLKRGDVVYIPPTAGVKGDYSMDFSKGGEYIVREIDLFDEHLPLMVNNGSANQWIDLNDLMVYFYKKRNL